ncbi:DUF445 family protein [bacterium]|nr:DUF445 family protein [bacterium]
MWWQFLTMPLGGALIGWLTNRLAIRMLFRPRKPRRILGLTVQGVLPRRRAELAHRVAEAIEQEFLSLEDIRTAIQDPAYSAALGQRVETWMRDFFREKLANGPRLLKAVVGEGLVDRLATGAAEQVNDRLPGLIEGAVLEFEKRFDVCQVVRSKIENFEFDRLEAIVLRLASRELRFIEVLGGVIGLLVGLLMALLEFGFAQ